MFLNNHYKMIFLFKGFYRLFFMISNTECHIGDNDSRTIERYVCHNKSNDKSWIVSFVRPEISDVPVISSLIQKCFKKFVEGAYSEEVVSGLGTLYTHDRIKAIIENPKYEVWLAYRKEKPRWVMALKDLSHDKIEINMYYGTCPVACNAAIHIAEKRLLEKQRRILTGVVLKTAWHTFERCGVEGKLEIGPEFTKTEKNSVTGKPFDISVKTFSYKPMKVVIDDLLFDYSFEAS
jgi:hypothetical protein